MRLDCGITDVAAAGTRVQMLNTKDRVLWARFTAPEANTGVTYVGQDDVSATNGYPLGAAGGEVALLTLDFRPGSISADSIYFDAAANGDDVGWAVLLE